MVNTRDRQNRQGMLVDCLLQILALFEVRAALRPLPVMLRLSPLYTRIHRVPTASLGFSLCVVTYT